VPEYASFDLDPQRSRFARRLRVAAQVLTGLAAAACLWALLLAPGALRLAAALAAIAVLAVAMRPAPPSSGRRLLIEDGGALELVRRDGSTATVTVLYQGSTHACLRGPDGLLPVWADALPAAAWRRLRVACRWPPAARSGLDQSSGSGQRSN
jgi:hypothetical protein